jgi:hypothetical protein
MSREFSQAPARAEGALARTWAGLDRGRRVGSIPVVSSIGKEAATLPITLDKLMAGVARCTPTFVST